ncbi:MAG: M18 family aminopeptidase [Erysipelotrichaceae bacterium]
MEEKVDLLLKFINESPSCFHAIDHMSTTLLNQGYVELKEQAKWTLQANKKYFVTRNGTSIIAFQIPSRFDNLNFQIVASHSDSPTYKIKPKAEINVKDNYCQLNVEGYGGMIASSWLDRPLSIAGRVIVKEDNRYVSKLCNIDEDYCMIPSLAIHMNHDVNNGYKYNPQVDMLPLVGMKDTINLKDKISNCLNLKTDSILDYDLYLYNRNSGRVWGSAKEFISSPKLDNLECAFTSLQAFLETTNDLNINMFVCFDNEEVGSSTKQGADGTFMLDVMKRIANGLQMSDEAFHNALASSYMVSADNAHAMHPNHIEKNDPTNPVYINQGIVIKYSARQSYTSDAMSAAIFMDLCDLAKVPYQTFVNRSDMPGGSTLGNISSHQVSILTCDIGCAMLAMHSAYESAGYKDVNYLIDALKAFYSSNIRCVDNTTFELLKRD